MPSILSQRGVETANLSDLLADFRRQLEQEAGVPAQEITTTPALILRDLCIFLEFGPKLTAKILGPSYSRQVEAFLDSRVTILRNRVQ